MAVGKLALAMAEEQEARKFGFFPGRRVVE